jgi:hypothetical protein
MSALNFLYVFSINMSPYARVPVFRPSSIVIIPILIKELACNCYLYLLLLLLLLLFYKGHPFVFCTWLINNTTSSTNTFIVYQYSVNNMPHVVTRMGPSTGFI